MIKSQFLFSLQISEDLKSDTSFSFWHCQNWWCNFFFQIITLTQFWMARYFVVMKKCKSDPKCWGSLSDVTHLKSPLPAVVSKPRHCVPVPSLEERVEANIIGATGPSTKPNLCSRLQKLSNESSCIRWDVLVKVEGDWGVNPCGERGCWVGATVQEMEESSIAPPVCSWS